VHTTGIGLAAKKHSGTGMASLHNKLCISQQHRAHGNEQYTMTVWQPTSSYHNNNNDRLTAFDPGQPG